MTIYFANISGGNLTSKDTGLSHSGGAWTPGQIIDLLAHTDASHIFTNGLLRNLAEAGDIVGYTALTGGTQLSLLESLLSITPASTEDVVKATGLGKSAYNSHTAVWYDTIQEAIDEVEDTDHIVITQDETDEDIVISAASAAKVGVVVESDTVNDGHTIRSLTINQGTGACNGWIFKHIGVQSADSLVTPVTVNGGTNITFDHLIASKTETNGGAAPVLKLEGTLGAEGHHFNGCHLSADSTTYDTEINYSTASAPTIISGGSVKKLGMVGNGVTVLTNSVVTADVTHSSGSLFLGSGCSAYSVTSTANFVSPSDPFLWISETRVRGAANVSGIITKSGSCPYALTHVEYDKTNSTFAGTESVAAFGDCTQYYKHITVGEGVEFDDGTTLTSAAGLGVTPSWDDVMEVNPIADVAGNAGLTAGASITLSAGGTMSTSAATTSTTATGAHTNTFANAVMTSTAANGAQLAHDTTLKVNAAAATYDSEAVAGSFMRKEWIEDYVSAQVPSGTGGVLGTVIASMLTAAQMSTADATYQICNGGSCVGTAYETLTANTTVPDMRGYALRGLDASGTVDPVGASRSLGDIQQDEFEAHFHDIPHIENWISPSGESAILSPNGRYANTSVVGGIRNDRTYTVGGDETRMKNVAVNYFIKVNN